MAQNASRENSLLSFLPSNLRSKLLPFQKEGVLYGIKKGGRVLIADEMGLGKTLQALSIAYYYKHEWPLLVLAPSSMRYPWVEEIEKWFPEILPSDISLIQSGSDIGEISTARITIATYGLLSRSKQTQLLVEALSNQNFKVIIADESHYIKNYKSTTSKVVVPLLQGALRKMLLTGTPALSKPAELFPQIDALCPGHFGTWNEYAKRYCDAHMRYFGRNNRRWNTEGASNLHELQCRLSDKVMVRRLKKDVLTQLPPKRRQKIPFELKDSNFKKDIDRLLQELSNLIRMSKLKISDVMKNSSQPSQSGSSDLFNIRKLMMEIWHATARAKIGPVCDYVKMLLEDDGVKVLLFAHHMVMMDGLQQQLWQSKVKFIRIDGSVASEDRMHYVKQFQSNPSIRVAILSIQAAGQGLTLTAGNIVVFAELHWTPGQLEQCEDRAHRIGQMNSVNVHYLVARSTLDEWVWTLLARKTCVVTTALNGVTQTLSMDLGDRLQVEKLSNADAWVPNEVAQNVDIGAFFQSQQSQESSQMSVLDYFSPSAVKKSKSGSPKKRKRETAEDDLDAKCNVPNITIIDLDDDLDDDFKVKCKKPKKNAGKSDTSSVIDLAKDKPCNTRHKCEPDTQDTKAESMRSVNKHVPLPSSVSVQCISSTLDSIEDSESDGIRSDVRLVDASSVNIKRTSTSSNATACLKLDEGLINLSASDIVNAQATPFRGTSANKIETTRQERLMDGSSAEIINVQATHFRGTSAKKIETTRQERLMDGSSAEIINVQATPFKGDLANRIATTRQEGVEDLMDLSSAKVINLQDNPFKDNSANRITTTSQERVEDLMDVSSGELINKRDIPPKDLLANSSMTTTKESDVTYWACNACTFHNEMTVSVCAICYTPVGEQQSSDGVNSAGVARSSGNIRSEPKQNVWTCLMCTYENSKRCKKCQMCNTKKGETVQYGVVTTEMNDRGVNESCTLVGSGLGANECTVGREINDGCYMEDCGAIGVGVGTRVSINDEKGATRVKAESGAIEQCVTEGDEKERGQRNGMRIEGAGNRTSSEDNILSKGAMKQEGDRYSQDLFDEDSLDSDIHTLASDNFSKKGLTDSSASPTMSVVSDDNSSSCRVTSGVLGDNYKKHEGAQCSYLRPESQDLFIDDSECQTSGIDCDYSEWSNFKTESDEFSSDVETSEKRASDNISEFGSESGEMVLKVNKNVFYSVESGSDSDATKQDDDDDVIIIDSDDFIDDDISSCDSHLETSGKSELDNGEERSCSVSSDVIAQEMAAAEDIFANEDSMDFFCDPRQKSDLQDVPNKGNKDHCDQSESSERVVNLNAIPVYDTLKFCASRHTSRIHIFDELGIHLGASIQPVDVETDNWSELPDLCFQPHNMKLVKRLVHEWNGLTNTKRRVVCKSGLVFSSAQAAYEEVRCGKKTTQRYLTKDDINTAARQKAKEVGGTLRCLQRNIAQSPKSGQKPTESLTSPQHSSATLPAANILSATVTCQKEGIPQQDKASWEISSPYMQVVGLDGVPLCIACHKPVNTHLLSKKSMSREDTAWQTRFCSKKCREDYWMKASSKYGRQVVFNAEHGICQKCNFNAQEFFKQLRITSSLEERATLIKNSIYNKLSSKEKERMVRKPYEGLFWQVDHIRPVYAGGGQCDIDNLRTLCTMCHRSVTSEQNKQRNQQRRLTEAAKHGDITTFFKKCA